jgi:tol-pal system protein YbgF
MIKTLINQSASMITLGAVAFGVLLLNGCVMRSDIQAIQTDIYNIQQRLEERLGTVEEHTDNVQTSQADLATEIQELNHNLTALQGELQDNRAGMERLSLRLDDLDASLSARMDSQIELLSGSKFTAKPLPSTVFNLANSDFTRGRYPQAIKGFDDYLKQFPKGEKVPEAKLKLADSYAKQKEWSKAVVTYDEVIEEFPKHPLAASAMFRKGRLYEDTGKTESALAVYKKVIQFYPYRKEATLAQDRFQNLKSEQDLKGLK